MPPKIMEKIKGAKERIEAFPGIAKKEMGWYRSKAGELRPAVKSREKAGATLLSPLQNDKSMLHTHTYPSKALPSKWDLWQFVHSMKKSSLRTTHIAQLGKNGKVIGYTSIRATKKLVEWVKNNYPPKSFLGPQLWENLNILKKEKYVTVHFRPMPGYGIRNGTFVKNQQKQ